MTTLARCCVCSFIIIIHWCSPASAQMVSIPDLNLESAIRKELNLPSNAPITQQEMLRLTRLGVGENQIKNLAGLEHATDLTWLALHGNEIQDLSPLAELFNLEKLYLWSNPISDLSPIANLIQLRNLDLGGCQISDIAPLTNLTQLESLRLHYNQISDITSLTKLTQLTDLWLQSNQISDIAPLANLEQLIELALSHNRIVDVSPLVNLVNLVNLKLAGNSIRDFRPLFELNLNNVDIDIRMLQELVSVEVEIPDPNLEHAIRDELALINELPLTQADMLQLTRLGARDSEIKYLTGVEYATNLIGMTLPYNEISDLTPLAELMHLEYLWLWGNPISDLSPLMSLTALKRIDLAGCQISDVSPLANLTQLTYINLRGNRIVDISALTNLNQLTELRLSSNQIVDVGPLANLTELTRLNLNNNRIIDVSPLANLIKLERLEINHNLIKDHSPLETLNLTRFAYDQVCELPRPPIQPRIENRTFPSVFSAWGGIGWSPVLNRPDLSDEQHMALHDFYWSPSFGLRMRDTRQGFQLMGVIDDAILQRDKWLNMNPNMIFIRGIFMRSHVISDLFPEDSPYWVRDANGNRVGYLINFTHPAVQDIIVEQALAAARCGYDGVFFDWWREDKVVLTNADAGWQPILPGGNEAEQQARLTILQRIRAATDPEFFIIVNTNRRKSPQNATHINGLFMETLQDNPQGYTVEGLVEIEDTLLWAEQNLRQPQVNCLEGWGVFTESPDSLRNRRWMRVFTTMSLTHSDGYVMYNIGDGHEHYWYEFWDANLGKPVGPKAQQYQNIDGLFIREFTNGWAVYNRSGKSQQISLAEAVIGVESGQTGTAHQLADLDGEIYLRAGTRPAPTDINGDGVVNILDLILVAQNFGTTKSDINGDGTTNILDLILVAQHLGETSAPAAPAALPVSLSPETVQEWIDMAHAQNDGSVAFAQGIAMLERLLALMIPDKTVLRANYPNPFNPETWIPYHLANDTEVQIGIYDIQGALVRQFNLGYQKAGYYTDRSKAAHWDGRNEIGEPVASGVYFYTLTTDDYTGTRRMVILK